MEKHQPRRRFGQNFLVDPHYIARIVDAVAPQPGDRLVEIGPGLAALTRPLIERAGHLDAVEIDRDLAARLVSEFPPGQLTLHVADVLDFDFAALGPALRVIGNLPYNISSPLLFRLAQFDAQLVDVHVMLQKEVVARMTARPATPEYGRLTVMLQAQFRLTRLFVVPAGAFRPAPKVDSAVVRLVPLAECETAHRRPRAVRPSRQRGVRPAAQDLAQCSFGDVRRRRAPPRRHRSRGARRDAVDCGFRAARECAGRASGVE